MTFCPNQSSFNDWGLKSKIYYLAEDAVKSVLGKYYQLPKGHYRRRGGPPGRGPKPGRVLNPDRPRPQLQNGNIVRPKKGIPLKYQH